MFAVAYPQFKVPVIGWAGERLSLYVYLFHKIVISVLTLFADDRMKDFHYWVSMMKPLVAMILSLCMAIVIYITRTLLK